ncbi:PREDICTED: uncharacterized protein LOC105367715 [Ceratosolen solmsi marchali]|uniref:Cilia-and flagella-associated protein 96 n=1 Tax=Ceratosolen solmsi marchali TaxID=326594 RepID=A0AAJ6YUU8_9HYME|nr:PREDICTED: uncharacterized protein LOC105367715 [Ceratosolen solmsi marchali]
MHFGKLDMDRIGYFDDSITGPFDVYVSDSAKNGLRDGLDKGTQIRCKKSGDFFEKDIKRIFIGEVLPELCIPKKKKKRKLIKLGIIKPTGTPKLHSTPGDWYGCIGKQPSAFSPQTKTPPEPIGKPEKAPANFMTNPNPVGGPGYLNICLNPYMPIYDDYEPYDPVYKKKKKTDKNIRPRLFVSTCSPIVYFWDNPYTPVTMPSADNPIRTRNRKSRKSKILKKLHSTLFKLTFPGAPKGKNSGCFQKFPTHMSEPYEKIQRRTWKIKPQPPLMSSTPQFRSKFSISIIDHVTNVALNANNFTVYKEQVYPLY